MLILFDSSYVVRCVLDQYHSVIEHSLNYFHFTLVYISLYVLCDSIPISCVLYYHSKNFRVINLMGLS